MHLKKSSLATSTHAKRLSVFALLPMVKIFGGSHASVKGKQTLRNGRNSRLGPSTWVRVIFFAVIVAAALFVSQSAQAATLLFWDANGSGSNTGGTGTWDSTASIWRLNTTGGALQAYTNTGGASTADFAGIAGTVTIANGLTINANAITFGTTGYVITGGNATSFLNLDGTTPTITTGAGLSETISAQISGSGGLTKANDTGTLILGAANTYTGNTEIKGGTISLSTIGATGGVSSGLGAGASTLKIGTTTAGTLIYTGTGETTDRVIDLSGGTTGATITQSSTSGLLKFTANFTASGVGAKSLTLNGAGAGGGEISGSIVNSAGGATSVIVSGAGNWTLSGTNSFTGGVTINAGTLIAGSSGAFNSTAGSENAVTFGAGSTGTLNLNGKNIVLANLTTNGTPGTPIVQNGNAAAATLTVGNSTNAGGTYAGTLQDGAGGGALALVKAGTGTLALTGANTFSGGVTLNSGLLQISAWNSLGNGSATNMISFVGGTLGSGGIFDLLSNRTVALGAGGGTFQVDSGVLTVSGSVSGSTGLTKSGAATLVLSGTNINTGATTLNAGTLRVATIGDGSVAGNLGQADSSAANLVFNGGALQYTGSTASTNRNFTINAGKTATFDIAQAGTSLTVSGVEAAATSGSLTKIGAGTLILSGSHLYTGTTSVNNGTLTLDYTTVAGKLADTSILALGGGVLNLVNGTSAHTEVVASTTLNPGGSSVTRASGTSVLRMNAITRTIGSTINFGAAGIADTDTNNVNGGILGGYATVAGSDWAVSATSAADTPITALASYVNDTWLAGNNTTVTLASNTAYANATTNSLRFSSSAANTVTLSGTGVITSGGILVTPAVGGNLSTITGGSLAAASGQDLVIHQYNTSNGLTIASIIDDNGGATSVTKSGPGLLTLSAVNVFSGGLTLNAGSLLIGNTRALGAAASRFTINGGTITNSVNMTTANNNPEIWNGNFVFNGGGTFDTGTGTVSLNNNISLTVNGANAMTVSGNIGGSGSLEKKGPGTLTLSPVSANTFSGGLTLTAGTLNIATVGTALGTGTFVVNGGAIDCTANATNVNSNPQIWNSDFTYVGSKGSNQNLNLGPGPVSLGTTAGATRTVTVNSVIGTAGNSNLGVNTFGLPSILTIGGVISDGANATTPTTGLTMAGSGWLRLNGALAYSGKTQVNGSGILEIDQRKTFTTSNLQVGSGATLMINVGGPGEFTLADVDTIKALGNGTGGFLAGSYLGIDLTNGSALDLTGHIITDTSGGTASLGLTFYCISGNGGGGPLTTDPGNTYTGATHIYAANQPLITSVLTDGGIASGIGKSSSAAANLVFDNGGSLQYSGTAAASTNRLFTVGNQGKPEIDNNGSGTLHFTNSGAILFTVTDTTTNPTYSLGLGGANTGNNLFDPKITDDSLSNPTNVAITGGHWTITNANTYTGGTTISSGGTLVVSSLGSSTTAGNLGKSNAAITIAGGSLPGTLVYTGTGETTDHSIVSGQSTGAVVIEQDGPSGGPGLVISGGYSDGSGQAIKPLFLQGSNTDPNTLSGSITDSTSAHKSSLTKAQSGTWVLSGTNTYSGSTAITGGVLRLTKPAALYSGSTASWTAANITVSSGATLALNFGGAGEFGSADVANILNIGGSSTTGFTSGSILGLDTSHASGGNSTYSGAIVNPNGGANLLGLTKLGSNTLTLTGSNTYTGPTTVNSGSLKLGPGGSLGNTPVSVSGGGIFATAFSTTGATFSGGRSLNLAGGSTLNLQDTVYNTLAFSGSAAIAGATLDFDLGAALGQNDKLTFSGVAAPSGTLNFAFDALGGPLAVGQYTLVTAASGGLAGGYTLNNSTATLAGKILTLSSDANDIFLNVTAGSGQAAIGAIQAQTGLAIISGGSTSFTFTVSNTGSSDLNFSAAAGTNTAGSVAGPVNVVSGGTSSATGGLSFSGTTVGLGQSGSFTVSDSAASNSPQTGAVAVDVYDHAGGSISGGTITLPSAHAGYAGSLAGTGSASVSNSGGTRVNLKTTGATSSGNVSINNVNGVAAGGSAAIGAALANGQAAGVINDTFTLTLADDSGLNGASGSLGSVAVTVNGLIYSGSGVWNTSGGGSWNDPSKWTQVGGVPGIDGPTLSANDKATFGPALTSGTAAVALNDTSPQVSSLEFNSANSYAIVQGSGSGSLTLTNTATGLALVTVDSGTHAIAAPLVLAGSTSVVPAVGTLLTISGNISGAGPLSLDGAGGLVLSGSNEYMGGTYVNNGVLTVATNNALADGSSLTVGAGGTFVFDPSALAAPFVPSPPAGAAVTAVPEPGTPALLAAGGLLALFCRKRWQGRADHGAS